MNAIPPTRLRIPLTAWILGLCGIVCMIAGLLVVASDLGSIHPILADSGTGIALIASAVALIGSAAFPIAFARLADRDQAVRNERTRKGESISRRSDFR